MSTAHLHIRLRTLTVTQDFSDSLGAVLARHPGVWPVYATLTSPTSPPTVVLLGPTVTPTVRLFAELEAIGATDSALSGGPPPAATFRVLHALPTQYTPPDHDHAEPPSEVRQ